MSLYYLQKAIYHANRDPQALLDYQRRDRRFGGLTQQNS